MDMSFRLIEASNRLTVMDRALHDPTPWTATWGALSVAASRRVEGDSIVIDASFPAACHFARPDPVVVVESGVEVLMVAGLDSDPGDGGFVFTTRLTAEIETIST